jgi:hypothetical protein
MYPTVKMLRAHGRRKSDREIQTDSGTTGDMVLAMVKGACELKLSGSRQEPIAASSAQQMVPNTSRNGRRWCWSEARRDEVDQRNRQKTLATRQRFELDTV